LVQQKKEHLRIGCDVLDVELLDAKKRILGVLYAQSRFSRGHSARWPCISAYQLLE
jgi:hypothetical protein